MTPPARSGLRPGIAAQSLENISSFVRASLGNPDVIPLWFGEGDLTTPAFVGEAMTAAVNAGHVFYTHQNGLPQLRETLAGYLTNLHAKPVTSDRITVAVSGMNAIMLAMQAIAGPGDNILILDPVWPNAAGMTELSGAEVRRVTMDLGAEGWRLDLDKVARALDGRTRGLFYASPCNPTGAMLDAQTVCGLLDLCRARGVWLMADEVYNRLAFDGRPAPSVLDYAEPEDKVLVINSFSKSWAMTGWRLGWLTHPPSIGPHLAMMTQYTTSGVPTFIQHAGVAAVREGEGFVSQMRAYCQAGVNRVCDALEGYGRVRMAPRPIAGMYAYFQVEGMTDSRAAALEILQKTQVGLAPGFFFGPASEGWLRLCACRSPVVLAEAMERLSGVLA